MSNRCMVFTLLIINITISLGVLIPNKKRSDGGDEKNSVVTLHTIINIHHMIVFLYRQNNNLTLGMNYIVD